MDHFEHLAKAFVSLADTLVADYDTVELTQQLIDNAMSFLPITAAGIVLGDINGDLQVFSTSSQQTRLLELLSLHAQAGPCVQAYRSREPVLVDDLHAEADRWPDFVQRADEYEFRAVVALPLRLRTERVGALNLFLDRVGPMAPSDVAVGQALADMAAIGIVHHQLLSRSDQLSQQLQTALTSRVRIEQAKGVIAERGEIDMDEAFALLRGHARRTQQRLVDVACAVVDGDSTTDILGTSAPSRRRG
jgi:GAF domain-containing protein